MSKGRRVHGDKELDELQRARKTIEKLKREVSTLRRQISRATNPERMADLHDLVMRQREEESQREKAYKENKKDKIKWQCHECEGGVLKIRLWPRLDGIFYNRVCSKSPECGNKTRFKKYNAETVQGILEEDEKEKI